MFRRLQVATIDSNTLTHAAFAFSSSLQLLLHTISLARYLSRSMLCVFQCVCVSVCLQMIHSSVTHTHTHRDSQTCSGDARRIEQPQEVTRLLLLLLLLLQFLLLVPSLDLPFTFQRININIIFIISLLF